MVEFDITRIPRYSSKSSYAHFDHRVSFAEVQAKILDSEYVSNHAFYPLLFGIVEASEAARFVISLMPRISITASSSTTLICGRTYITRRLLPKSLMRLP